MLDPKWTGTDFDRREMRVLNLHQVVRRNFGTLAMFGFSSTLLATWEVIAVSLGVALPNGGTAGLFWNYLIGAVGFGFIYASIAELGSMFPTSGGQYYWVAILAPRRYRRYLSYITGWLCAITWQTGVAAAAYTAGTLIQGLFILNIETYVFERWHGTLLTFAFLLVAILFNSFLARKLPMIEGLFVFCHILGVVIFIPLWFLSPKRVGGSPLVDFYNSNGWWSTGLATMVGTLSPTSALIGFDCSVHMAEETKDSSRTVPITLLVGYGANVILGIFVILTCIYTIGPLDTALNSATGYPVIDMFFNATQSHASTSIMTTVIIVCDIASAIAALAAASRQLWAFARSRGLPFSNFFAPDHLAFDIPLNAVVFSLVLPFIIALLNIGSTAALASIFSIYNSALIASYMITISCVLWHRLKGGKLPYARYSLGKWGILVNIVALVYVAPIFVFSFFPSAPKPTPASMNWAVLMVGGVALLATIYYIIWGRTQYSPPGDTVEEYIKRAQAGVTSSEREVSRGVTEEKIAEESVEEAEKRDL